jgi:hypothetical protein
MSQGHAANNDCYADEFQRLGKLINEGMDLVGQIPDPLSIQQHNYSR